MKDNKRIIQCCICIVILLIFTIVYAEETASTTDLIEYDAVYAVTNTDNVTTLNATFTVTNSENGTEEPLLIAAIYDDGRLVTMETAQPTIVSGATINETVSVIIPEDKTDSYYIKLFVWEGTGNLRALGKERTINDIDSYSREKLICVTATENQKFKIQMNASTVKGGETTVVHTIRYDTSKIVPVDLCGFTYDKELITGEIENTNITIRNVDFSSGKIEYEINLESGRNTGIINLVEFKALADVIDETIFYTVQ